MKVSRGLAPGRTPVKATTRAWLYGPSTEAIRWRYAFCRQRLLQSVFPQGPGVISVSQVAHLASFSYSTNLAAFNARRRIPRHSLQPQLRSPPACNHLLGEVGAYRRAPTVEPPAPAGYRRYGRILGQTNMSARCFGEGWLSEHWSPLPW